jgi:methylphosphotriester-DNA--protein-cysteine methyltransferase
MDNNLRDTIFEAVEECLDAQLRAVRRLRKTEPGPSVPRARKRMSQVDMAYDILVKARKPLHISELLERIQRSFQVTVDRESLVSSLTKKVMRGDRFIREDRNTFAVKERPS